MKLLKILSVALSCLMVVAPLQLLAAPQMLETLDSEKNNLVFNGTVYTTTSDGETLYVGGDFSSVSQSVGDGVFYDEETEERHTDFPKIERRADPVDVETVYASISDGAGGWYIAGDFDYVGGEEHPLLVHILANGNIDEDFDAGMELEDGGSEVIYALALSSDGETLYIGGLFTEVDGEARGNFAALDAVDGSLQDFDVTLNDTVRALAISPDDETVYVGGSFTLVNGATTRHRLASFVTADGSLLDLDPDLNGSVQALTLSSNGETLYMGGNFTCIGEYDVECLGVEQEFLAAINTGDDTLTAFDPNPSSTVYALQLAPGDATIYVGGSFSSIGGQNRRDFAEIDTTTGLATVLNANITSGDDSVHTVALSSDGQTIYIGGMSFTGVGGEERQFFSEIDSDTGVVTSFYPSFNGAVRSLSVSDGNLFIGGAFYSLDSVERAGVAAIDLSTYMLTDFDPGLGEANVMALELSSDASVLYIGGDFSVVNYDGDVGLNRYNVAAVHTADGVATAFSPFLNSRVDALDLSQDDQMLYVGGVFSCAVGFNQSEQCIAERVGLAAFDTNFGGTVASFDAQFEDTSVLDIVLSPDEESLYVTASYDGEPLLVALDASTATELITPSFSPDGLIRDLEVSSDGETLYVGGEFTSFSGDAENIGEGGLFNTETGALVDSQSVFSTNASTIHVSIPDGEGGWYIGGTFNRIDGEAWDSRVAHILPDMSIDPAFEPAFEWESGTVYALTLSNDGSTLYVGGEFNSINSEERNRLAALDTSDGSLTAFDPNMDGSVRSIALSSDEETLYVGGSFLCVGSDLGGDGCDGGVERNRVAAITISDSVATEFDPNVSGMVRALDISEDEETLYVGGGFTMVNGDVPRKDFAAFSLVATGTVTSLDPGIVGVPETVHAIAESPDGQTLYLGGDFYVEGGADVSLVAVDMGSGEFSETFPTFIDEEGGDNEMVNVLTLSQDGGILYVGGYMPSLGGNAVALSATDGTILDFDPRILQGSGDFIYTISGPQDGNVFIGGSVLSVLPQGGGDRDGVAALSTSDFLLRSFAPDVAGDITIRSLALTSDEETLYVAGDDSEAETGYLAAFSVSNGSIESFGPNMDAFTELRTVRLSPDDDELYVGGDAATVEPKLAVFSSEPTEEDENDEESGGGGGSHRGGGAGGVSKPDGDGSSLQSLLALLRKLIAEFILQGGTPSPAMLAFLGTPSTTSGDYARDLDIGDVGDDVRALQNFLIAQNKGPQARTLAVVGATGFFGPLTQVALAEFQASVGITPAAGYFGPVTRAYINGL